MKKLLWILPLIILGVGSYYLLGAKKSWPTQAEWELLNQSVGGRLIKVDSPLAKASLSPTELKDLEDPFVIEEYPWGTQSTGWMNGWSTAASPYAVAVQNVNDIVAAVKFAKQHNVKLVVKGTGHDYLGRSNAPDSLLVWTHPMRNIAVVDAFKPVGAPAALAGVPAVTVEAGARWLEVYREVTTRNNRYVQGGGCASVGAAGGFIQGGGFGSFSKKYGMGAAGLLEAEIVIASGEVLVANAYQNADLFWALKGGGGGTFGIVSKVTLATHELPVYFGFLHGTVTAKTDEAYQALIEYFLNFYNQSLSNEHWGEQVAFKPNNTLELALVFQGLDENEEQTIWKPFYDWIDQRGDLYSVTSKFSVVPANKFWDYDYLKQTFPELITSVPNTNGIYYWASNQNEVLAYWYVMHSRWMPRALFQNVKQFSQTLFQASRYWYFSLHFNKGLAYASEDALQRSRETSINPAVLDSPALFIIAAQEQYVFAGMKGHEPDTQKGLEQKEKVNAAVKLIDALAPNAGTYSNEADYFQQDWQTEFWGENYPKLLQIKKKYDPDGFFKCHHCVGSE
ncbi:MAG: FAD-binding oxidoreductase [Candidatus Melainabacteria bacterium]|nr:FAD-binding oxidoreductase [Candidatus Melainabacteria bacterium]